MSDENPFRGLRVPAPPPGLRERALSAARSAPPATGAWERILRSRSAAIGWAASVACLAALHVVLSVRSTAPLRPADGDGEAELAAVLTLPDGAAAPAGSLDAALDEVTP